MASFTVLRLSKNKTAVKLTQAKNTLSVKEMCYEVLCKVNLQKMCENKNLTYR